MSELYVNLSLRYQNKIFLIDDDGLKGVILMNETKARIREMLVRYKYSKYGLDEKSGEYRLKLIEFVKFALTKGYDWKLYGKPQWEEIAPKKRKKFIKPRF